MPMVNYPQPSGPPPPNYSNPGQAANYNYVPQPGQYQAANYGPQGQAMPMMPPGQGTTIPLPNL
jgi:hypothetical protein